MLRDGLLTGTTLVVAGQGGLRDAIEARAAALGAAVTQLDVDPHGAEPSFAGAADVLVYDASAVTDVEGARTTLDGAWLAIRATATGAMIEHGGGLIALLAPAPGGAPGAAARAGLENLARTLSVEWARFHVRPVAILPGTATTPADVAELVAFLASPAGGYYSGCAFELSAATG